MPTICTNIDAHNRPIDAIDRCVDRCPNPCAHAHKFSFLEHAQKKKNANYIIIIPRKTASNQVLPGPSTSGFSSPSESPWEVQQEEKVIN